MIIASLKFLRDRFAQDTSIPYHIMIIYKLNQPKIWTSCKVMINIDGNREDETRQRVAWRLCPADGKRDVLTDKL